MNSPIPNTENLFPKPSKIENTETQLGVRAEMTNGKKPTISNYDKEERRQIITRLLSSYFQCHRVAPRNQDIDSDDDGDENCLPAHSHHDKIPPWWEYISNGHSHHIFPPLIMIMMIGNTGRVW